MKTKTILHLIFAGSLISGLAAAIPNPMPTEGRLSVVNNSTRTLAMHMSDPTGLIEKNPKQVKAKDTATFVMEGNDYHPIIFTLTIGKKGSTASCVMQKSNYIPPRISRQASTQFTCSLVKEKLVINPSSAA